MGESSSSTMWAGSGSCQASSPVSAEAARYSATAASSPITPACRVPRAVEIAPVRVATSTITSGCSRLAATRPSASTSRPSASVFSTSTVVPSSMRSTSPGRVARPEGMLSARHSHAVTRTGRPCVATARSTLSTVAAPHMSYFMPTIDPAGFSDKPPVSNVMPFPTSATCRTASAGAYSSRTSRGGRSDPWPTPRMPP